ncbi:hypothetical protein CHS0354_035637, partial [Potamilus streckersoni]
MAILLHHDLGYKPCCYKLSKFYTWCHFALEAFQCCRNVVRFYYREIDTSSIRQIRQIVTRNTWLM